MFSDVLSFSKHMLLRLQVEELPATSREEPPPRTSVLLDNTQTASNWEFKGTRGSTFLILQTNTLIC